MDKNLEFIELVKQIENSKGYKIDSDAHQLELGFNLMVINYGYLKRHLNSVPVFSVEQREQKDKYMTEATLHFVNFLSSAGALRDHTRKFIRDLYGTDEAAFGGEYKKKIQDEFTNDPLSQLIEAMRNHYCHLGIPPVGIEMRMIDRDLKARFVVFLKSIDLSESPKAKLFVEGSKDDTVDVLELAEKYTHKSIFVWIIQKLGEYHKDDFDELERLREKARVMRPQKHSF